MAMGSDTLSSMDAARRRLLQGAGLSLLALATCPARSAFTLSASAEAHAKSRLILLGTAGGSTPKRDRSAPASAIVIGDAIYVIDCGDGVARQLVLAGLDIRRIREIFITHQHSDHNADYGNLVLLAWETGLNTPVNAWGPPPLTQMTRQFLDMQAYDIRIREQDEGRTPLAGLFMPHEVTRAGDAGCERARHRRAGAASAGGAGLRLPLRLPRPFDRVFR